MKKILIVPLFVLAAFGLYCVISSIAVLFFQPINHKSIFLASEGERINVSTEYLTPCVYEVEHRILFIPSVNEYYYAFMDNTESKAYLVRLSKEFGEDLSGNGFRHVSSLELGVTGKVKKLKNTAELQEVISQFEQEGIPLYSEYYLDTIYQINYLWRIAVGVGLLLFSSAFAVPLKNRDSITLSHKVYCCIVTVIGIAAIIVAIFLLQLG